MKEGRARFIGLPEILVGFGKQLTALMRLSRNKAARYLYCGERSFSYFTAREKPHLNSKVFGRGISYRVTITSLRSWRNGEEHHGCQQTFEAAKGGLAG